jgi:hypothetical protein
MEEITIPKHTVIQYVRNNKNIPQGVLVAIKSEDGFRIGYSLCNKKDRFNKRMALKIAIGRAEFSSDPAVVSVMPHPVKKMASAFWARCRKYYKVGQ